jgi:fructose-specific phosphotransferase system IIB component
MRQLFHYSCKSAGVSFPHRTEQGRSTLYALNSPSHVGGERNPVNIVAVTACPSGIAHTYMAAEQIERTARHQGHIIKVEAQGAAGIENRLTQADVDNADAVIIAADIPIEHEERFARCQNIMRVAMHVVLKSPQAVFAQFEHPPVHAGAARSSTANLYR